MAWPYIRNSALDYALKAEPRGLAMKLDVECVRKKGNKRFQVLVWSLQLRQRRHIKRRWEIP